MGWLGLCGLSLTACAVRGHGGGTPTPTPTPSIGTPVITQTSTAGASPFAWSAADDETWAAGDYWEVARTTGASTAAASAALVTATPNGVDATLGSLNGHAIQQITQGDLVDTSTIVFADLTSAPAGPIALRIRVGQEDGMGGYVWGNWSNILTDTLVAVSTAALVTTSGVNKNQYIDATGSPALTAAMNNNLGATCGVRTTTIMSSKAHWEYKVLAVGTLLRFSASDSASAIGPAIYPVPGVDIPGWTVRCDSGQPVANLYYNGGYVGDGPLVGSITVNDYIVCEHDRTSNQVQVWHVRGASVQLITSFTMTSSIPTNPTAQIAGVNTGDSASVNFGATTFVKTPTAGFSFYG